MPGFQSHEENPLEYGKNRKNTILNTLPRVYVGMIPAADNQLFNEASSP